MRLALSALALCALTVASAADLTQLLDGGRLSLTLYPGQTRALVRERRTLQLPAGDSLLAFTWSTGRVDAATVTLAAPGAVVGEALRPAGQDKALQWRVSSPAAAEAQVTVSYFLDGCKWQPVYRLWLGPDGRGARLEGWVQLTNESGQELRPAEVQIAVEGAGVIDRVGGDGTAQAPSGLYRLTPPGTLPVGDTRTWQFLTAETLPVAVEYRYEIERYKGAVERLLCLDPTKLATGSGALPPAGALSVYGAAQDTVPLVVTRLETPPGKTLEVDLGAEPDVVVERKQTAYQRSNFERDRIGKVSGFDTQEEYDFSIRNHLAGPITLRVTEMLLSTWELRGDRAPDQKENSTVAWVLPVPGASSAALGFTLVKHSGTRVK